MKMPVGKSLSDTQTKSSRGTPASGVVDQTDGSGGEGRGARLDPVMGAQMPGRGLSKTETRNSPGVQKQS